jgi:hypothetical protein
MTTSRITAVQKKPLGSPFLEVGAMMFIDFLVNNPSCQMAHFMRQGVPDPLWHGILELKSISKPR